MKLATLYNLDYYRALRSRENLEEKVSSVAANADVAGSVIHLKLHFKKWLEVNSQMTSLESKRKVGS